MVYDSVVLVAPVAVAKAIFNIFSSVHKIYTNVTPGELH
jgi:hypothetical protein